MNGSCHCGAVRYRVDAVDQPFGHCHCVSCRKTQAAAFATTGRVSKEKFHWLSGEDMLSDYESSPGKIRRFCSACGCHILAVRDEHDTIILRVASLDDDPGLRPAFHIWCSHDVPWLNAAPDMPHHEQWPPDRTG